MQLLGDLPAQLFEQVAHTIALSRDVGVLSVERAQVLVQVNALRDLYAHAISYCPEVSEIAVIFSAAELVFTDCLDGIKERLVELGSAKNFTLQSRWLLFELFLAIVYDHHQEFVARGGDEERP